MALLPRRQNTALAPKEALLKARRCDLSAQREKAARIAERETVLLRRKAELECEYQKFLIAHGEGHDGAADPGFPKRDELDKVSHELVAVSAALQNVHAVQRTLSEELTSLEQQLTQERRHKFLIESENKAAAEAQAIADAFLALAIRLGRLAEFPEEIEKQCGENAANQFAYELVEKLKVLDLSMLRANHGWTLARTRFHKLRTFSALFQPILPSPDWKSAEAKPGRRR